MIKFHLNSLLTQVNYSWLLGKKMVVLIKVTVKEKLISLCGQYFSTFAKYLYNKIQFLP